MIDKFTNSNKFTSSYKFTESKKFTHSNVFKKSDPFTMSSQFSFSELFTQSFLFSEVFEKSTNKTKIGIIAGSAAGVAAIIAVAIAFFLIRKRRMIPTSDFNMLETNDASITMRNELNDIMDEDDPFKNDF